jgi:hypothetical protein
VIGRGAADVDAVKNTIVRVIAKRPALKKYMTGLPYDIMGFHGICEEGSLYTLHDLSH